MLRIEIKWGISEQILSQEWKDEKNGQVLDKSLSSNWKCVTRMRTLFRRTLVQIGGGIAKCNRKKL